MTAPLVSRSYAMVLNGCSLGGIAAMFNEAEAFGLKGQPWTHSTVSLFLRKPRNAGLREYNGAIIGAGTWPVLVDKSVWRAVQSILSAIYSQPGQAQARPKSVRQHLLTGLLTCGKCGHHLAGTWTRQAGAGGIRIAYSCKKCRGCSIRAEHVEPMVYKFISGRLAKPDVVDLLKAPQHDEAEAERMRIERQTY